MRTTHPRGTRVGLADTSLSFGHIFLDRQEASMSISRRAAACSFPRRALIATVVLALSLTACSGDGQESSSSDGQSEGGDDAAQTSGGDFPVTISSDAGEFTLQEPPERIVSLSPSATEILFAIGAGDQVVAVDSFSTYPDEAPVTDLSGFDPNVEAVTGYEPDLVVISNDANDLVASLTELDVPVLVNPAPADIEDGYAGMAEVGVATGHVDETAEEISRIRSEVDTALEEGPEEPVRVYHELDNTFFTASSNGFVGSVYAALGATNIADEADTDGTGFPQMTEEAIISADPELIVITDQVDYTAEDVAQRPGWEQITAVQEDNIVTVDADVASRWGPRLPQFVSVAADALTQAAAVPAG
jgi:iron complex transport system substrate-binding protein